MLSVIMITYGHELFIEEALKGVFMQNTDFPFELIIANDCSPDQTDALIKRIISEAPDHIEVNYTKHEKNKGMSPF